MCNKKNGGIFHIVDQIKEGFKSTVVNRAFYLCIDKLRLKSLERLKRLSEIRFQITLYARTTLYVNDCKRCLMCNKIKRSNPVSVLTLCKTMNIKYGKIIKMVRIPHFTDIIMTSWRGRVARGIEKNVKKKISNC